MFRNLLLSASCIALSAWSASPEPVRLPILVELFTSEGCSSCPPADRHLQRLDSNVIVLSEHVDYWDRQGWKDPFSSPAFTERQEGYARQLGLDGPYTPEMVVDGAAEFVGGDYRRAAVELDKAAERRKAGIALQRTRLGIRVDIEDIPGDGDVWLALADNNDFSKVMSGENKGQNLSHVAVVRSMSRIGSAKRGGTFSRDLDLPGAAVMRVVVFLQQAGQGHVLGAAMLSAPPI